METIDFVIAWVDGADPAWQAEKAKYRTGGDGSAVRYRDWDTLRYWFRAVETYAPWVNRIHFVTWGHVPAWLYTEHSKVHIVRHDEFIPKEYLPTFSSHPIELNLHRIEGLAEHFVYFNDDFFLTAPVKPTDFFRRGIPRDSLEETPLRTTRRELMNSVNANDIIFLNQHFRKGECRRAHWRRWYCLRTPAVAVKNLLQTPFARMHFYGLNNHHLPQAYCKSTLEKVWRLEPQWLRETCTHKFRTAQDVSQCVFKYYQLATGNFDPVNKRALGRWFPGGSDYVGAAKAIRERRYRYICFNDSPDIDFETARKTVAEAFEAVHPNKCTFEK